MPRLDAGDVAEALRLWREGRTIRDNALRKLEKSRTVPAADTLPQLDERRKQIRWLLRDAGPDVANFEPWGEWWTRCFDAVSQTPVVQKSAVPIDWKAIQDRDAEVLEWFERLKAATGVAAGVAAGKGFDTRLLTESERAVYELIATKGPIGGKSICNTVGCEQSTLTGHIIPSLKKHLENHGVSIKNRKTVGYYLSQE